MNLARNASTPEKHLYLWLLAAAPAIWAGHFLLSYITVAIWCAKYAGENGSLGRTQTLIAWYTVAALAGIGVIAAGAFKRHGRGFETDEHGLDTPDDRHRFLGFAALLLAGLSAVATVYVGLSSVFVERCY